MFASELILGFSYLLCDSPAHCRFSEAMGGFKALFETHKWKHNSSQAFMPHRRRRNVINFHSISRKKFAALEVLCANSPCFDLRRWCISPQVLWFVLWLKVVPRPSPFTSHALKVSPAHRCGHFHWSWLNLLGDSGSLTDGSFLSALLPPIKRHCHNICFSCIFVPARRQPEMRSEPE